MRTADPGPGVLDRWPDGELEHVGRCPVCGGAPAGILYEGLTDRVFRCAPGLWTLHSCAACESAYLDPRPNAASVGRAYRVYYTHAPPVHEAAWARRGRRWLRALVAGYLNRAYHAELRPAPSLGAPLVRAVPPLRRVADRRVRHLVRPAARARLLDVGCGSGAFVAAMRDAGWEAHGVDIDEAAVAAGRRAGLDLVCAPLDASELPDAGFEALTLSHVIEHVHDPRALLAESARKLHPGGVVWIATPNLAALGHRAFGRDWLHLDPPRHLTLFTRGSLRALLESVGLVGVREPLPLWRAHESFPASAAIQAGQDPLAPHRAGNRRVRAWVANARAWRDRERAEEIVMIARRP